MKLKHTQKKSANIGFDTSATGFQSESYRKQSNKIRFTKEPAKSKFTKPKTKNKKSG